MVQLKFETEHDRSFDRSMQTLSLQISRTKVSVSFESWLGLVGACCAPVGGALVLSGTEGLLKQVLPTHIIGVLFADFRKHSDCAPIHYSNLSPLWRRATALLTVSSGAQSSSVNAPKFDEFLSFISFRPYDWCRNAVLCPIFHTENTWLKTSARHSPQLSSGAIEKFVFGKFDMKRVQSSLSFCRGTLCTRSQWGLEPLGLRNNMWDRWGWTRAWIK